MVILFEELFEELKKGKLKYHIFPSLTTSWLSTPQMWCDRISQNTLLPFRTMKSWVHPHSLWSALEGGLVWYSGQKYQTFGDQILGMVGVVIHFRVSCLNHDISLQKSSKSSQEDPDFQGSSNTNSASLCWSRVEPVQNGTKP